MPNAFSSSEKASKERQVGVQPRSILDKDKDKKKEKEPLVKQERDRRESLLRKWVSMVFIFERAVLFVLEM